MTGFPVQGLAVVVMGVSGCGKSTLGLSLAQATGAAFTEGDALHPPQSIEKMANGVALSDEDRFPWLDRIGSAIARERGSGIVVSCSSLRRNYRDRLRNAANGPLLFVHLEGDFSEMAQRLRHRSGHFMPSSLLQSQFETLETPIGEPGVIPVPVLLGPADQLELALAGLKRQLGVS